jgi:uncharacterized protein (TIGR02246 family)
MTRAFSFFVAALLFVSFLSSFTLAGDSEDVMQAVKSYAAAFNKGDAAAVAAHWTENGEFLTPSGQHLKGRAAIQKEFAAYFAESKGAKVEIEEPTIEFLSPGVAREIGRATVARPNAEPQVTEYEAIHVKLGDGWKMDSVRESAPPVQVSHYENLKQLEWMIGTWVDQDENSTIETSCQWTKNQNFLLRSFKVAIQDRVELEGTQIVGWDPVRQTVRSWVFDSDGGFGVGRWSRNENEWTVRSLHVMHGGRQATAIHVFKLVDDNTFTFRAVGRELDGQVLPNIDEVAVVRQP